MDGNWKSSVLQCNAEDDDCKVCRFLAGNRDQETLLEVIRIIDSVCGQAEQDRRHYMNLFMKTVAARN